MNPDEFAVNLKDDGLDFDKIYVALHHGDLRALKQMKIEPFVRAIFGFLQTLLNGAARYRPGKSPETQKGRELMEKFDVMVMQCMKKEKYQNELLELLLAAGFDPALVSIEFGRYGWKNREELDNAMLERGFPPIMWKTDPESKPEQTVASPAKKPKEND
jgi:hypothetical protein